MTILPRFGVLLAAFAVGCWIAGLSLLSAQGPAADKTLAEVLTRGPVHEAFAQPYDSAVQIDPVVPQKPPEPIPENPPDLRPEGSGVGWIPGYWAWDAESNEFIWISGVYRDAPAGRKYVAGYWEQTSDGGWRWVHGFWASAEQKEMPYVPQPPAPLEVGPSLPPPSDDATYVPGCWIYREARYVWRPGYYAQSRPGLVWVPARYVWTPGGCLYVSGYWDYPLDRRGLLFAPVVFRRSPWLNPGWAWQPTYVVGTAPLLDSLFVDTRFGHYRFGDWYGKTYLSRGIQPWYQVGTRGFDPLYSYYRSANRNGAAWQSSLYTQYANRLAGKALLPPRSLNQQTTLVQQTNSVSLRMVQPMTQVAGLKLTKVGSADGSQARLAATQMRDAGQARKQSEALLAQQSPRNGKLTAPQSLALATEAKSPVGVKAAKSDLSTGSIAKSPPLDTRNAIPLHKEEMKPASQMQHDLKTVHTQSKAAMPPSQGTAKSAGVVKSAAQPPAHQAASPAAHQLHASRPKPPPAAHASASHSKAHGK